MCTAPHGTPPATILLTSRCQREASRPRAALSRRNASSCHETSHTQHATTRAAAAVGVSRTTCGARLSLPSATSPRLPLARLLLSLLVLFLDAPSTTPLLGRRLFGGRTASKANRLSASKTSMVPSSNLCGRRHTTRRRCSMKSLQLLPLLLELVAASLSQGRARMDGRSGRRRHGRNKHRRSVSVSEQRG